MIASFSFVAYVKFSLKKTVRDVLTFKGAVVVVQTLFTWAGYAIRSSWEAAAPTLPSKTGGSPGGGGDTLVDATGDGSVICGTQGSNSNDALGDSVLQDRAGSRRPNTHL